MADQPFYCPRCGKVRWLLAVKPCDHGDPSLEPTMMIPLPESHPFATDLREGRPLRTVEPGQ